MPDLTLGTLVAAAVLAGVAEVLLLVSTVRPRPQTPLDDGIGVAPQPRVAVEALWTVIPALFLAALFIAGVQTMGR